MSNLSGDIASTKSVCDKKQVCHTSRPELGICSESNKGDIASSKTVLVDQCGGANTTITENSNSPGNIKDDIAHTKSIVA